MAIKPMFLSRNLPKAKAKLYHLAGRNAVRCSTHRQVVGKALVQEESTSKIRNELQGRFHGCDPTTRIHHPARFLYTLENVWLVAKEGHVFFDDNTVFAVCPYLEAFDDGSLRRPVKMLSTAVEGSLFHLTGRCPENKAHFLVEHLPRLLVSERALGDNRAKILLSPGQAEWQISYLEKLGISGERCVEGEKGTLFCREVRYTPLLCSGDDNLMSKPENYVRIRQMVRENTLLERHSRRGAIFISRKDAPDRFLVNEDEVVDVVKSFFGDVRVVRLTGTTHDEQTNMFANASLVIGPHGQGFRNALFTEDGLVVQLTFTTREESGNPWCDVFSNLAILSGSRALTLYSGSRQAPNGDWEFPASTLRKQLTRLQGMV